MTPLVSLAPLLILNALKKVSFHFVFAVIAATVAILRGAPNPAESEATAFTTKELRQGFRERVILARPHPAQRTASDAAEAREGFRLREKFARFRELRVLEVDGAETADAAMQRLRATGRYEFVEPDFIRELAIEPNDPQFTNGNQWNLKNTGQAAGIPGADIKAPAAWDLVREAPNVVVAVIDTGLNLAHQDIAGNLWRNPAPTFGDVNGARFSNGQQSGNPADDAGHGTHVAGIIGAMGDNNLGTTGVAWRVQIMAIKALTATGGSVSDIARGVNYAIANGAHIINASYGSIGNNGFSNTELAAITAARDAGVIFVAAAGNAGANMDVSRFYPASHSLDNIVTVGNSTRRDELALSSNYGSAVDLFAPGSEIVSLNYSSNTGTTVLSGTSMAAPHVAGALALLKARFPADNHRQLINRLLRGTAPGERYTGKAGTSGRLDLFAALTTTSNRPFNDDFASRPKFNSDNLALRGSNAGATAEPGEPSHGGGPASATLWWEWTAPTSNLVSIETSGSNYDTMLAVYTGNAPSALTLVAANDNDSGKLTSRISFTAQAGTTYQIAVDGRNGATGLTLLNVGTTPLNDAFATPVTLSGESTHLTATNSRCTLEPGEPRIGSYAGGTSLWYRWTAPRNGRFQLAVVSSDFDPLLAVYTGSTLNTLALVNPNLNLTANDKSNGAIWTVEAIAGTSYAVTVDTKDVRAVGQFTLSVTDSRWQFPVGQAITGAPAMARDGTIYFGSIDRSLYAIAPDGTQKWSFVTPSTIDTASPTVADDGTVYVGSNDGTFYAFNPDGSTKWTHVFGVIAPVSNSPALAADGTIYVKAGDGYLYALAPTDGTTKWKFNVNGPTTYASPSVAPDGTIYQGSEDRRLYAINPDGTQKWFFAGDNDIYTVPAIDAAGNVYFSVLNNGKLFSVSPAGTLRWSYSGATTGSSSSAVLSPDGGTVYFGGYDSKLHAVNTATGAARWTYPLAAEVRASSPAVDATGVVYIGCYDFRLYAINPNGTLRRTYDTGNWIRSSPAILGNTLYVGSNDRKLYAFDVAAGAGSGPWPQYRHNARRTGRAVTDAFTILSGPQSQAAVLGLTLTLNVVATGEGPLSYEWKKDGVSIVGATAASYNVANVTAASAGTYTVLITGPQGTLTTAPAVITAEPITQGRLINLSVRTGAGTGAQTLIMGFTMSGSPDKAVLIRAIGPSLAQFGVPGVLGDPRLQLFGGSAVLTENDNWAAPVDGSSPTSIANAFALTGAFKLEAGSRDAALVRTMAAGGYTAQVSGVGSTTGVALAELYDTAPTTGARLINLSARAQVETGGGILIAGFTISGNVPKQVLIRGIGPTLAVFGVTGILANPKLEVFRGTTKVNENDNWGGSAALIAAFQQVGAFSLANTASGDAALVVMLPPGGYTAQLSGVGNTTGIGLIEVYELP